MNDCQTDCLPTIDVGTDTQVGHYHFQLMFSKVDRLRS